MPKVSIIMPVLNDENYLCDSVESILNQTYKDFEFIIICEYGNSKASTDIVKEYAKLDDRIIVIENDKQLNIASSLNKGIDLARGEYIARMDSDDISIMNRLAKQVVYLDSNDNIDICASDVYFIDEQRCLLRMKDPYPFEYDQICSDLLFFCCIRHPTVMMRKSVFNENKLYYNPNLNTTEDYEYWSRVCQNIKIVKLPESLLLYRWHTSNATKLKSEDGINNYLNIMKSNFLRLGMSFSQEQLRILCIITCELTLFNVYKNCNFISSVANEILNKNHLLKIYDPECLLNTLNKRMFWKESPLRLIIVLIIRGIASLFFSSLKMSNILKASASYIEIHGVSGAINRISDKIFKGVTIYNYDEKKLS